MDKGYMHISSPVLSTFPTSAFIKQKEKTLIHEKIYLELFSEEILEWEDPSNKHAPPRQTVTVIGKLRLVLTTHIYG